MMMEVESNVLELDSHVFIDSMMMEVEQNALD